MTELELITNPNKRTYIKVSLLDDAYQEVKQMQGELIDLNGTISADSAIRRVTNAVFHIDDPVELGTNFFGVWMDRMVQISYGVYDPVVKEIRWMLLGSFLFQSSGYTYDRENRQMSLSIGDMMVAATEERGSQIGTEVEYVAGAKIEDALAATIARFSPYKRYDIEPFEDVIPYDIKIARGSYPYEGLNALVRLFPWYEQYYSKEGVYTAKKVTTAMNDPVVMTAQQMKQTIISESGDLSYSSVKNATEIWGKEIDANYTAKSCTSNGGVYNLNIHSTYEKYEDGTLINFTPDTTNIAGQKIRAQELDALDVYNEAGDGSLSLVTEKQMQADRAYVVKYKEGKFILQGEAQIHAMCMEYREMPSDEELARLKAFHNCNDIKIAVNPDSDFACDVIGVVKQVFLDGEYSNIYSTELALERAAYENWKSTKLLDTLTIETLFMPWLDVNQKILYTSIATGRTSQYIIREIQMRPLTGVMSITLVKFCPLYPWLDDVVDANWLIVEDDDAGNVHMYSYHDGAISVSDDNNGNVEIVFNLPLMIDSDGQGNITFTPLAGQ